MLGIYGILWGMAKPARSSARRPPGFNSIDVPYLGLPLLARRELLSPIFPDGSSCRKPAYPTRRAAQAFLSYACHCLLVLTEV